MTFWFDNPINTVTEPTPKKESELQLWDGNFWQWGKGTGSSPGAGINSFIEGESESRGEAISAVQSAMTLFEGDFSITNLSRYWGLGHAINSGGDDVFTVRWGSSTNLAAPYNGAAINLLQRDLNDVAIAAEFYILPIPFFLMDF